MRACRDEVGDSLPRIMLLDESFTDENGVGARRGIRQEVVRAADAALCDLDDGVRQQRCDARERLVYVRTLAQARQPFRVFAITSRPSAFRSIFIGSCSPNAHCTFG